MVQVLALVVVFVIFLGCMMYWFNWGEVTDEGWGCTANTTCCTCDPPALTYKLEDYWNERMTRGLSALFTYSVLLATPWRLSILGQCLDFHGRIKGKTVGVDFYGKPNEMPFYHIPWGARLAIALLLNLNTFMQLVHQILHFVWADVVIAFEQPQAMVSLVTGPLMGCICGGPAAIIQNYWDNKLHAREPSRFPPSIVQALHGWFGGGRQGVSSDEEKSPTAATASAVGDVRVHDLRGAEMS